MNKKNIICLMLLPIILLAMIGLVSAVVTWRTPASDGLTLAGYENLSVTTNHNDTVAVTFEISCTDNANTSSTVLNNSLFADNPNNYADAEGDNFSTNWSSSTIEDSSLCTLTANTTNVTSAGRTVIIDNTVPNIPTGLYPAADATLDNSEAAEVAMAATVTDANITSCTLLFSGSQIPDQSTYAMVYSTTTCTKTIYAFPSGTFTYLIRASDGSNTTNSASTSFTVKRDSSGSMSGDVGVLAPSAIAAREAATTQAAKTSTAIKVIIAVAALYIIYQFGIRKKKKLF